ncbi:MAG: NADH-quinone oxidoreductase subunit N [Burkholderiales bacterium]
MNFREVLVAMAPEHVLLLGIVVLLLVDILSPRATRGFGLALLVVCAAAAIAAGLALSGTTFEPFTGQVRVTPSDFVAKAVVLALAAPIVLLCADDLAQTRFFVLAISSLYGACLMLSADSFLTLFVGFELMSLPLYVMVMIEGQDTKSAEAALKYLVLGGVASGSLLLGASLLYGGTGSLSYASFTAALGSHDTMALAGVALVTVAFMLKAAVVPFHAWAPDAYEGAGVPVTAYMATVVKAAVLLAAVRLFAERPLEGAVLAVVAILPLASIVWGNLAAMRQKSFRRMIAYSSIAHAGYLFYVLLGDPPGRYQAVLFYALAYGVMNVLAFAALPRMAGGDRIEALSGLFSRSPFSAFMIAIAMLSLAGIPPLPGFVAKFLIFKNAIAAGYTTYAVLGLVGSYLGIYFYLRVIQLMFMKEAEPSAAAGTERALATPACALCLGASLVIAVFPGWVLGLL